MHYRQSLVRTRILLIVDPQAVDKDRVELIVPGINKNWLQRNQQT